MKKLKFKFILPLLLALMLALGSCMTVFAAGYVLPDGLFDNWVILDLGSPPPTDYGRYMLITCDGKITHLSDGSIKGDSGGKSARFYISKTLDFSNCSFASMNYGSVTSNSSAASSTVVIDANTSVFNEDGTVFFRVPLARLAVPLQAEIMKHLKVILPVGVGCLALLIGSVVLLPRLRKSLLKL